MQAVAERLDCAVGTIYTYFSSKAALLAALQAEAVRTLLGSYATARETWDPALDDEELDEALAALVHLQGFGAFFCSAAVVFRDEFELQRLLLTERPPGVVPEELRQAMPVVVRLTEVPRALLDDGRGRGGTRGRRQPRSRGAVARRARRGALARQPEWCRPASVPRPSTMAGR